MEEPGRKFFEKTVGRRLVVRLSPVLSLVRARGGRLFLARWPLPRRCRGEGALTSADTRARGRRLPPVRAQRRIDALRVARA